MASSGPPATEGGITTATAARPGRSRSPRGEAHPSTTTIPDVLWRELQAVYDLSLYEAKVLLALLQCGPSNSNEIARIARLPRTSTYPVIETLIAKGAVERVPGDGVARWRSPDLETVLGRLEDAQRDAREALLQRRSARASDLRTLLRDAVLAIPAGPSHDVEVIRGIARVNKCYERVLGSAERELLMFTRPPYAVPRGYVNPAVLALLARGVPARAIYQIGMEDSPEFAVYHDAGVVARMVDHLPLKVVVVDRRAAILVMADANEPDGYPTTLHIEYPAFAELVAVAFEVYWAQGTAYEPPAAEDDGAAREVIAVNAPGTTGKRRGPIVPARRPTARPSRGSS